MDSVASMRVFVGVVEAGSFSAAGRQLGLAPSSVSRRIGEHEAALGVGLFHRTTRKLSLTEAGELYYQRAAKILVAVDEARLAVAHTTGAPSGILRLTVPASVGRHMAAGLAVFQEMYPSVQIVLSMTDRLVDIVEEGFDLAVRVGRQRDSSLIARKIGAGRRIVCASPGYLERTAAPTAPRDLTNHNCLIFRSHPGPNIWRFQGPDGAERVRASGSLVATNGEALAAAASAGLGVILVPEWLVGIEIAEGRLREVLTGFQALPDTTPLYAVYAPQRHLPPKVRAFVDFLVERFGGRHDWRAEPG